MDNNQEKVNQQRLKRLISEHLDKTSYGNRTVFVPIDKTQQAAWDFLTAVEQTIEDADKE